jgi:amino acid transporter
LATTFPEAGGMIKFAEYSQGPLMSFTVGWIIWLSSVVIAPTETIAMIQYIATYVPGLMKPGTILLTSTGFLLAALIMLFMCLLNSYSIKFFSRASTILVGFKLFVPLLTICVLLILNLHPNNISETAGFMPMGWHSLFAALPLGGIIFSFIGYNTAIQLAGEAHNPQRSILIAVIGSLVVCIILYSLLQLAFIISVDPKALDHGWAHLSFTGHSGPFASIVGTLGITWLAVLIYMDAIVSPFGTGFLFTAGTARVNYALAEINFFPKILARLNQSGVPLYALILNYIVGLLLFIPFPNWQMMVSFIISCFVISFTIGPIALVILRHTQPHVKRPFRLPLANLLCPLAFYICNLLVFWTGWQTVSKLLIAMSMGFCVFYYRYAKGYFKKEASIWQCALWLLPYLMGIGLISYYGSFGGGQNRLTFGIDFVVIAVFSLITYSIVMKSSARNLAKTKAVKL